MTYRPWGTAQSPILYTLDITHITTVVPERAPAPSPPLGLRGKLDAAHERQVHSRARPAALRAERFRDPPPRLAHLGDHLDGRVIRHERLAPHFLFEERLALVKVCLGQRARLRATRWVRRRRDGESPVFARSRGNAAREEEEEIARGHEAREHLLAE